MNPHRPSPATAWKRFLISVYQLQYSRLFLIKPEVLAWFCTEEIFQKSATESNTLLYYNDIRSGTGSKRRDFLSLSVCDWWWQNFLRCKKKKKSQIGFLVGMLWQFVRNKWNRFFSGTNWPQSYQRNYKRGDGPLRAFWIDESAPPETADVWHITQIKSRPSTLCQPDCADVREQSRFTTLLTVSLLVRKRIPW